MLLNFSNKEIYAAMVEHSIPTVTRKSIAGMLKSFGHGREEACNYLEKQGIVRINWDHHCKCGACDPEPAVSIKLPGEKGQYWMSVGREYFNALPTDEQEKITAHIKKFGGEIVD